MDRANWRGSLTASERYDNIQKLNSRGQSGFAVENEAYKTANSREEYDARCNPPTPGAVATAHPPEPSPPESNDQDNSEPGITIGHYQDCHYVASGVTAAVYRSEARALKVIVETHNIAPHNPQLEAKILDTLRGAPNIIPLLETFRDQDQRFVLVFPYQPLTLAHVLDRARSPLPAPFLRTVFTALFRALHHLHAHHGIIHRDVKPSALLLSSSSGCPNPHPSRSPDPDLTCALSDFGTAYHPSHSPLLNGEPASGKVLDVGTGPYRAPETLFGDRAYSAAVDLWAAGATLAECVARPRPRPLFESRPAHEDGNQLGLILSIFQTLGSPTPESWPEARGWRTPPWGMYREFEGRVEREGWGKVLGLGEGEGGGKGWIELVKGLLRFESGTRITAGEALEFPCLKEQEGAVAAS